MKFRCRNNSFVPNNEMKFWHQLIRSEKYVIHLDAERKLHIIIFQMMESASALPIYVIFQFELRYLFTFKYNTTQYLSASFNFCHLNSISKIQSWAPFFNNFILCVGCRSNEKRSNEKRELMVVIRINVITEIMQLLKYYWFHIGIRSPYI